MKTFGTGSFRYRVDSAWPGFPAEEGEAVGVACDSRDRVFVFVRGEPAVRIFDAAGKSLGAWDAVKFARPHGMFIDAQDRVFCTDDFDHTIRVFTVHGEPLLTLGTPGNSSDTGATSIDYRAIQRSAGPFHFPTNVALGPRGDIYVSDGYGNARVHRFSPDGNLLRLWGEPGSGSGQFHVPHGIAVDRVGNVFVADRENSRIQIFCPEGSYLAEWTDVARPCQVFFDAEGMAYVAELGCRAGRWPGTGEASPHETGGRVSIFTPAGELVARWGGGEDPCASGDFYAPHDICVDSRGDVYVAEVAWSAGGRTGKVAGRCHTLQKFVRI